MKIILIQAPPRNKDPQNHRIETQILDYYAEGLTLNEEDMMDLNGE